MQTIVYDQQESLGDPSYRPKTRSDMNRGASIYAKRRMLLLVVFALVYFLLAKFGMALFALKPSNITLLWLPSGLALIMFLKWKWLAAPAVFTASFAANIEGLGGFGIASAIWHTSVSAGADTLAGVVSAFLYKRYLPHGFQRTKDLIPLVLLVCLLTTLITSCILAGNLVFGGYIEASKALSFIRMLVLADSLGILLILPIYEGWESTTKVSGKNLRWLASGLISLSVILVLINMGISYTAFFILPILLILSFNLNLFLTGIVLALSMVSLTALTAAGLGPLVATSAEQTNFLLVAFMFSTTLTVLGLAIQNRQLLLSELLARTLKDEAQLDVLTGLLNRRAFFNITDQELKNKADISDYRYTVAMLDLDHFKSVNDEKGHAAGDLVLKHFSKELKKHCRDADVVARIGGEEFAVFLPRCGAEQAFHLFDRLRDSITNQPVEFNDEHIQFSVSVGVAEGYLKDIDMDQLLIQSDKALYHAKRSGRNQVRSYSTDL